MDEEQDKKEKRFIRICREPSYGMSGPMGTAILSRVPSFRVQRDDEEKAVFCAISRLARHLAACGMSEPAIQDAIAKAVLLEEPGDFIELELL
jgi:hypothetical protein